MFPTAWPQALQRKSARLQHWATEPGEDDGRALEDRGSEEELLDFPTPSLHRDLTNPAGERVFSEEVVSRERAPRCIGRASAAGRARERGQGYGALQPERVVPTPDGVSQRVDVTIPKLRHVSWRAGLGVHPPVHSRAPHAWSRMPQDGL